CEELTKLFQANKLSADQVRTALANYTTQLDEASIAQKKLEDSKYQKMLESSLATLPKLTSETQRLMGEHTLTGASLDRVADKHEHAYGQAALHRVAEMALAYVGIERVIEYATEGLRAMEEQAHAAGERTAESLRGAFQIVQASR